MIFGLSICLQTPKVFAQGESGISTITITDRYEFHSNLWINMHHFLYKRAEQSKGKPWKEIFDSDILSNMSDAELEMLCIAIEYYKENLIGKDLLFDDQMYWTKRALIQFAPDEKLDHEAIDPEHQEMLNNTKEVYANFFWNKHDRQNRKIVNDHIALILKIENKAFDRIAELAQQPWPNEKVRVDVSYYSNWAGAYCTVTPIHALVTSQTEGPEGWWSEYDWLELVFHEPSHAVIYPGRYEVGTAIQEVAKELGVEEPRGLWHAILFYFSGITVQELLKAEGIEHQLTMITGDIFSTYHATVFEHMPGYVGGEKTLEKALKDVINEYAN